MRISNSNSIHWPSGTRGDATADDDVEEGHGGVGEGPYEHAGGVEPGVGDAAEERGEDEDLEEDGGGAGEREARRDLLGLCAVSWVVSARALGMGWGGEGERGTHGEAEPAAGNGGVAEEDEDGVKGGGGEAEDGAGEGEGAQGGEGEELAQGERAQEARVSVGVRPGGRGRGVRRGRRGSAGQRLWPRLARARGEKREDAPRGRGRRRRCR